MYHEKDVPSGTSFLQSAVVLVLVVVLVVLILVLVLVVILAVVLIAVLILILVIHVRSSEFILAASPPL